MSDGGHICQRTETKLGRAQLGQQGNIPDKFRNNQTSGFRGDKLTGL